MSYNESTLEQATLDWLSELGYEIGFGPDLAFDGVNPEREEKNYVDVVLRARLESAISRINPLIPVSAQKEALDKIIALPWSKPGLVSINELFHQVLVDGVEVSYQDKTGLTRHDKVKLFDFDDVENNNFLAVNQFTVIENNHQRRPDILVFINGLPIAIFELKNPGKENATIQGAFNQLQTYKSDIPSLFSYNELCVIGDGVNIRLGSLTADFERFMKWKNENDKVSGSEMEVLLRNVFAKNILLDIIKSFIVFQSDGKNIFKILAAYHQYYATNKAVAKIVEVSSAHGDRRGGVVWHTQGSGKSLTMVFYAGKIIQVLDNPTLVVLTDRNDLDNQLFDVFTASQGVIRQTPVQAQSRSDLKKLLSVASGGVVFTTIQKFMPQEQGEKHPLLSDRSNIVVIADEAHRSQYDFMDGFARHMHDALPKASFIGFTGTPIELSDKNTRAVFGEYVDIYDISRAVEDKATVPIYYEARLAKIDLLKEMTPKIDADFEELTEGEEVARQEKLKSKWAKLEAMIGSDKRIALIAQDVVNHFTQRLGAVDGKGMYVSMSRRIAVELYEEIIKLKPEWASSDINKGFIKVVMTGSASDPANFQPHIHNKEERGLLARRMKDPKDELKLVIVRDMWLTGFDAPSLHTMYIDKPMQGHGLMQAIARVNRVYKDKQGGLIVDYLGIAPALKRALSYYSDNKKEAPTINQEEAIAVMQEKYEIVKNLYHGFDYSHYFLAKATEKTNIISAAMNFILGIEKGKERYLKSVTELSYAFSLAVPSAEALAIRDELAFFQMVRALIVKFQSNGGSGGPSDEDYDQAIKQLVSSAVTSDKVINIFDAAGLKTPNISVLSDEFLDEVSHLEHKNVALELLKRLLNDEVRVMERKFLVKSRAFSKMLSDTIRRYQNQSLEAAQVINELVELAKKIKAEKERGVDLKLAEDEVAFYDALCDNESAVLELGDETLKKIAQELVSMLRRNTSIDWTMKEMVQAKLRVLIKKLLNKYKYPPDKQEQATKLVLEQAEVLCRDWSGSEQAEK